MLIGSLCFVVGTAMRMGSESCECEEEETTEQPYGFNVVDGGVVDGGESEWED